MVRSCVGCNGPSTPRKGPVMPFLDAYWHRACFAKASPKARAAAASETQRDRLNRQVGEGR